MASVPRGKGKDERVETPACKDAIVFQKLPCSLILALALPFYGLPRRLLSIDDSKTEDFASQHHVE